MAENEIFWGLNIAGWTALTAIGTFGIALATILVAVVAGYQISEARRETRTNRTMEIIGRYDHDPVLEQALRHLAEGRDKGDLASNVMAYRLRHRIYPELSGIYSHRNETGLVYQRVN